MKIIALAAVSLDGVIAINGEIPWHIKEDMKHYKSLTTENYQIMGYKTYLTMPEVAFKNRTTMVITNKELANDNERGVGYTCGMKIKRLVEMLRYQVSLITSQNAYIVGGQTIYDQMIDDCDEAIITWVNKTFESQILFTENNIKYFPINKLYEDFEEVETTDWLKSESEGGTLYKIVRYARSTKTSEKETYEDEIEETHTCKGCKNCQC